MAGEYGFDFWYRQGVASSQLTYRLWGQPGLISSCYLGLLPRTYRCRAVKLTTGVLSGVEDNTLSCSSVRMSWSSSTVLDTGQILYFTVTLSVGEWRCFSACNCFHPRVTWSVQRIIENPPIVYSCCCAKGPTSWHPGSCLLVSSLGAGSRDCA